MIINSAVLNIHTCVHICTYIQVYITYIHKYNTHTHFYLHAHIHYLFLNDRFIKVKFLHWRIFIFYQFDLQKSRHIYTTTNMKLQFIAYSSANHYLNICRWLFFHPCLQTPSPPFPTLLFVVSVGALPSGFLRQPMEPLAGDRWEQRNQGIYSSAPSLLSRL